MTTQSKLARAAECLDAAKALVERYGHEDRMPADVKAHCHNLLKSAGRLRQEWEAEPQYNGVDPRSGVGTVHSIDGPAVSGDDVKAWAEATADKIIRARTEGKAFNSGVIDAALPIPGRPLATLPTRTYELFRTVPVPGAAFDADGEDVLGQPVNSVSYLRQTVRTSGAEFVPDGGEKPTSVFTLTEVEDRLRVIAHLSEPIPRRFFDDNASLRRFLTDELRNGLLHRLNGAIVNGDDSNPTDEFDGLLVHAGTPVAFDTDIPTTTADVLMAQLDAGETPTHWIFRGATWNALSLTKEEADGTYLFGTPADGPGRRLHGLPVILEPSLATTLGMLVDRDLAELRGTPSIRIDWDGSGELFDRNQLKARCEWRTVLAMYRPSAFKAFATSAT